MAKYWCGVTSSWNTTANKWGNSPPGIVFAGSRTSTTLTVTTVYAGSITPGAIGTGPVLYGNTGTVAGTITEQLSGTTGGAGTYKTSSTGTLAASEHYTFLAGTVSATAPANTDDVVFGAVSVPNPVVTLGASTLGVSLTVSSPSSGVYTFAGTTSATCSGSFTLAAGTLWTHTGNLTFSGAPSNVRTNGVSISSNISQTVSNYNPTLLDNFNGTGTINHTGGTITLGGYNWSCSTYTASGTTAKTVAFGATGTITCTTTATSTAISCTVSEVNLTLLGAPTFVLSGNAASGITRTISFTHSTWGGSAIVMPAIHISAGQTGSTVALTVPINGNCNLAALDCTGHSGSLSFTNANSSLYIGDYCLIPITTTLAGNTPSAVWLTSTTGAAFAVSTLSIITFGTFATGSWVQAGDIQVSSLSGYGMAFNTSGTVTVGALGMNRFGSPHSIAGPLTINVGTGGANISGSASGSVVIDSAQSVNLHTFSPSGALSVSAVGDLSLTNFTSTSAITTSSAALLFQHGTTNIPSASVLTVTTAGQGRDVVSVYGAFTNPLTVTVSGSGGAGTGAFISGEPTAGGVHLKLTCAANVVFSDSGINGGLRVLSVDATGYTGTSLRSFYDTYIRDGITVTTTIPVDIRMYTYGGGTFTYNAPTATFDTVHVTTGETIVFGSAANLRLNISNGTLNAGSTVFTGCANFSGSAVVDLQSSTWNITSGTDFQVTAPATFTAGTSTIKLQGTSGGILAVAYGFNNVVLTGSGTGNYFIRTPVINTLSNSVSPNRVTFQNDCSITNFNLSGTPGNLVTVVGYNSTQYTLTKPTAWNVGANSVDGGNNTGLNFSAGGNDYLSISDIKGVVFGNVPVVTVVSAGNFFFFF